MVFFMTAQVMQEACDLGQEASFAPQRFPQGEPLPFDVSQGPGFQGNLFRVIYSMTEVLLQFVEDEGPAFHDLRVFIKKGARQIKRLSAANIKAGLRKRGGNISRGSDHLFINVFHQPSPEIR
jgi:hypothetical protein